MTSPMMTSPARRALQKSLTVAVRRRQVPDSDLLASQMTGSQPPPEQPEEAPLRFPIPFGRYTLERLLGEGGMGMVFLAHDSLLDRKVALKIQHFTSNDRTQAQERFFREARAAATLDHPNICPVYDVGEFDSCAYITMAYIDGVTLSQVLANARKPPSQRQIATLIRKIAVALAEAHRCQIVHRDLKPGNIMINQRGEPVVMDFGLARRTLPGEMQVTNEGDILGTPAYMAPEQARGQLQDIGPATDIYGLGVILYELLTSQVPFVGQPTEILKQLLTDEPPQPRTFRPDCDPLLEGICLKAMARDPRQRYSSMLQLASELASYLKATAANRQPRQESTHPESEDTRRSRPRRRLLWGVLAALFVVMAVTAFIFRPRGPAFLPLHLKGYDPSVQVRIDGRLVHYRPDRPVLKIPPGRHTIVINGRRYQNYRREIILEPGNNERLLIEPELE